jgi:mRNA interferase MazF
LSSKKNEPPLLDSVFWVRLDPTQGAEKQKTRPCLVLTPANKLGLVVIAPITDAGGVRPSANFVPVPEWETAGFSKAVMVDVFQLRAVDVQARFGRKIGTLSEATMDEVRKRLVLLLAIERKHVP